MRIDKISVENFRLFEKQDFSFHPQFNLIVGVNGSGKSSLLRGVIVSLRYLMEDLIGECKECNLKNDDILTKIIGEDDLRVEAVIPVKVTAWGAAWLFRNDATASELSTQSVYFGAYNKINTDISAEFNFTLPYTPKNWPLESVFLAPLIVFYGCDRLWLSKSNKNKSESAMKAQYSRRDGYKGCMQAQTNDAQLIEWLLKQELKELQKNEASLGKRILVRALTNSLQDFEHLSFMVEEGDLVVHFTDGRRQLFKHMSDGQRCMIGLIGDMVRRAVLLNPQLGDEILEKTAGVVLIDELDLHLHPTWQRRIIDDLRNTFPKVQFICTTHSPQLIGQAKADEIILLGADSEHPPQSYGMDSNWILRHIMGSDERDASVKEQLDDIFEYIEDNQFDEAENEIKALRAQIGKSSDLPDLQEAEALITRYSRFDDAEDK